MELLPRRRFLARSLVTLGTGLAAVSCQTRVPRARATAAKGKLILGLCNANDSTTLRVLDLETRSHSDVPVPLSLPHAFMLSRRDPNELFVFEMMGSAAKVRMGERAGTVKFLDHRERSAAVFAGHAVQSEDGTKIYSTEFLSDLSPVLRTRSAVDLSLIDEGPKDFPIGHHVIKLPGTDIAVSGSGASAEEGFRLAFYDLANRRLLRKTSIPHGIGHLAALSKTEVVGVTLKPNYNRETLRAVDPRRTARENLLSLLSIETTDVETPVIVGSLDGRVETYAAPSKRLVWGFGVDHVPGVEGLFLTGHYMSNLVVVWKNGIAVDAIEVRRPLGLFATDDGSSFAVLTEGKLEIRSVATRALIERIEYEQPIAVLSKYG